MPSITVHKISIAPGERKTLRLPLPDLYTHTRLDMPVQVVHGSQPGPVLLLSAALHGDEINGAEIIRRVLASPTLAKLRGTVIAVPVVNVYGWVARSRYLPDRRDLNRSFPGSSKGSLAARVAKLFVNELLSLATHAIDYHTGAIHRTNLPQIRIASATPLSWAQAFGAPIVIASRAAKGTLRRVANDRQLPLLLYEGGEALRFDESVIRTGVRGTLTAMRGLTMLPPAHGAVAESLLAEDAGWLRAPQSGIMRAAKSLGVEVGKGDTVALISDPFGEHQSPVKARHSGVIIGRTRLPLVNEGDALFNVARIN